MKKTPNMLHLVMELQRLIEERKSYIKKQLDSKSQVKKLGQAIKYINDEIENKLKQISDGRK